MLLIFLPLFKDALFLNNYCFHSASGWNFICNIWFTCNLVCLLVFNLPFTLFKWSSHILSMHLSPSQSLSQVVFVAVKLLIMCDPITITYHTQLIPFKWKSVFAVNFCFLSLSLIVVQHGNTKLESLSAMAQPSSHALSFSPTFRTLSFVSGAMGAKVVSDTPVKGSKVWS